MSETIKLFLELDNYINENYSKLTYEEYEEKVKELNSLCNIIINN